MKTNKEVLIQASEFLASIPDERWQVGSYGTYGGRCCAVGHLGLADRMPHDGDPMGDMRRTVKEAAVGLLGVALTAINDGRDPRFQQPTPKARVLAALDECISKIN